MTIATCWPAATLERSASTTIGAAVSTTMNAPQCTKWIWWITSCPVAVNVATAAGMPPITTPAKTASAAASTTKATRRSRGIVGRAEPAGIVVMMAFLPVTG